MKELGLYQKVKITEQTTDGYSVLPYYVEKASGKYMYGVDEMDEKNRFYIDEIKFEGDMTMDCFTEKHIDGYRYIKIISEDIRIRKEDNIAIFNWSNNKNSYFDSL